jgi:PKD repeat protein
VCQWGLDGRQEGCVVELVLIPGTYHFNLTVTDQYGAVNSADLALTVHPEENLAPTVDAGSDTSYTIAHDGDPETDCVTFDLTGSAVDEEGDELVCEWTDSAGNPLSETTVTECGDGDYTYTLTCIDSYGANNSATVTISIEEELNFAPTADAGEAAKFNSSSMLIVTVAELFAP